AHWARGAFDQLGPGPLRQFARVREQVPNALGGGEEDVGRTDFHRSVSLTPYYAVPMAMGKRKRTRQPTMWVATTDFFDGGESPVLHAIESTAARASVRRLRRSRVRHDMRRHDAPAGPAAG